METLKIIIVGIITPLINGVFLLVNTLLQARLTRGNGNHQQLPTPSPPQPTQSIQPLENEVCLYCIFLSLACFSFQLICCLAIGTLLAGIRYALDDNPLSGVETVAISVLVVLVGSQFYFGFIYFNKKLKSLSKMLSNAVMVLAIALGLATTLYYLSSQDI